MGRSGIAAGALLLAAGALLLCTPAASGACPFAHLARGEAGAAAAGDPSPHLESFMAFPPAVQARRLLEAGAQAKEYEAAVKKLDLKAVKADLTKLMTDSQSWWPADMGHYGGLFIRLAWHAAGSYRSWDGRGGSEGGHQRFDPELSWPDNTNLDKARKLLEPIKQKYGKGLSYGDLYALAGTVALESMGLPPLPFCAGRVDDADGTASLPLGPTPMQRMIAPCTAGDGMCEQPLGQTTMGLIYVNPEGVMGEPVPEKSVAHIRSTFGQMGMNDQETVALIGGGHAFGKTHGACPTGAGPGPDKDPKNPWPGTCGSGPDKGKGKNAFTSGFEGHWTTTPTEWSNEYFKNLLEFDWEKHKGPGGHFQWRPINKADGSPGPDIMMLTADVALLKDPVYLKWVKYYSGNLTALTEDFGAAWYKLMSRDMGPVTRCVGSLVAAARAFQQPLPPPPSTQPDWSKVKADVRAALTAPSKAATGDTAGGKPYFGALFATLAYQCAATFRETDHAGGCNGARIRFAPQSGFAPNAGLDKVLEVLKPIKDKYPNLTWADLIVLAGTVAAEDALGAQLKFCPGRSDAAAGDGASHLAPRNYRSVGIKVRDNMRVMGMAPAEGVALWGRPRSAEQQRRLGYSGSWAPDQGSLSSNEYFKVLVGNEWVKKKSPSGKDEYEAKGKPGVYMLPGDLALLEDPELAPHAKAYAQDEQKFKEAFAAAWTKLMNADRFAGPVSNACDAPGATV